jgi:ABC-type polysaccharide/polyol phosphate export permease
LEEQLNWSHLNRLIHRWTGILFTLIVTAIFASLGLGIEPAEWVYLLPLAPLSVMMLSGLGMLAVHYAARWRTHRRVPEG